MNSHMLMPSFLSFIAYTLVEASAAIDNNVIFERVACYESNSDLIASNICEMRPVAPNFYRTNITAQFKKPLGNLWAYTALHYRYSTYQRIAHQWEDICFFLRHSTHAPVQKILFDNLKALGTLKYTPQCPMTTFSFTQERLNVSHYVMPLRNATFAGRKISH